MITKELLQTLCEFDIRSEARNNPILTDSLEKLDQAAFKLKYLLIGVRVKKIMAEFEQKSSDIYVQAIPRAGTTLAQMMLYQMTTDGNMDFDHLYDVSPWYIAIAKGKTDEFNEYLKNPPDYGSRKIIKSHLEYSMYNEVKKGKFVYILRDGKDQSVSGFHQYKNYFDRKMEYEKFVPGFLEDWFQTNETWLRNERGLDILYLNYEDMVQEKESVVYKLADFLDIPITTEIVDRVMDRTSFSFMKKHETKFGEQPKDHRIYDQFIRKGEVGNGKEQLTKEQLTKYNESAKVFLSNHEMTKRYFVN